MEHHPDESDPPRRPGLSEPMLAGRKVLVVADRFEILEVIAHVLGTAGCDVLTTESALAARAILAQADFDLLITDMDLEPLDADGVALATWARALRPALRLLYLSGRGGERRRAMRPGQSMLLPRPFRLQELVSSVERALVPGTLH